MLAKSLNLFISLVSLVSAGEEIFRDNNDLIDVYDGAFESFQNLTFWDDAIICNKYMQILFWDGVDTVNYGFTDRYLAVYTFGLMMHKSPIIYKECFRLIDDVAYLDEIIENYDSAESVKIYTNLIDNLIWNLGDILKNLIEARSNLNDRLYFEYGKNIGQMVADIFFVNPVDEAIWTEMNSRIINDGTSEKVPSSFYQQLEQDEDDFFVESPQFKFPSLNLERFKNSKSKKQQRRKTDKLDKFMNIKPLFNPEDQDKPLMERIMKAASPKKQNKKSKLSDFQRLEKKKRQEKNLMSEIEQLLL